MKLFSFALLIFFFGFTEKDEPIQTNLLQEKEISEAQQALIEEYLKPYPDQTQGAFAFIKNGELFYYGVLKSDDSLTQVNNEMDVFEIGSISKVFTSVLLAEYVNQGKISLNDHVNKYLDFSLKDSISATFLSLANHTSGFPRMPSNFMLSAMADQNNPYKNYDEKMLKYYLENQLSLSGNKGKKSEYSNLGAGLLGYTLSKVSSKSYEEMLKEYIFTPLQMDASTSNRSELNQKLIKGIKPNGSEASNWDLNVLAPAGGILSNAQDMTKFMLAQLDTTNAALNLSREKTFTDSPSVSLGLGWHIITSSTGNQYHWHNGGTGGYTSSMAVDVSNKTGVLILTNISTFHQDARKMDELCFKLMATLNP